VLPNLRLLMQEHFRPLGARAAPAPNTQPKNVALALAGIGDLSRLGSYPSARRYIPWMRLAARPLCKRDARVAQVGGASSTEGGHWEYGEAFVAFDVAQIKQGWRLPTAIAVARFDLSARSPVRLRRWHDSSGSWPGVYGKLHFCYEAGTIACGLYRQIQAPRHSFPAPS
jgi:hypothetical protein